MYFSLRVLNDVHIRRCNEFYLEVHYEETSEQDESIQRVLAERGKTVYATAVRAGAILVDNGNLKLLGDVKVFGR